MWPSRKSLIKNVATAIDGSTAAAGELGQVLSAQLLNANAVTLSNNVSKTVVSLALTPGRWRAGAIGQHLMTGLTGSNFIAGISDTDNTLDGQDTYAQDPRLATLLSNTFAQICPERFFNVGAGGMTIYLVQQCSFALGQNKAAGSIWAERIS